MILTMALTGPSASWKPEHISVSAAVSGENQVVDDTKLFM
jgi:hypothetical protein